MKTCSKCKKDLPRERFVKSPRYLDGLYPICKDCRKATRLRSLADNPLCRKCKKAPHVYKQAYCEACERKARGRTPIPKYRRKKKADGLCSKCNLRPKLKYHHWCNECKLEATRKWLSTGVMLWKNMTDEQKKKAIARGMVNRDIARGKLKKKPCEVCGALNVEAHHHKGYEIENALDIQWLCPPHHDEAERVLKSKLTEQPLLL